MKHTGSMSVRISSSLVGDSDQFRVLKDDIKDMPIIAEFGHGTGVGAVNNRFYKLYTIAAGTDLDLDLSGGLTSELGAIEVTKLKGFVFHAPKSNTGNISVGRPAANGVPFVSVVSAMRTLTPGGFDAFCDPSAAGVTVTAATADLIKVTNATGAPQDVMVVLLVVA